MKKFIILACIIAITAILALGASSGALGAGFSQTGCGMLSGQQGSPAYAPLCQDWPGPTAP
ncbi:MAG: hypothetical protein ACYCW5_04150 [Thermoleophilia bacterium]